MARQLELSLNLEGKFLNIKLDKSQKKCLMCGETNYRYMFPTDKRTSDGKSRFCWYCTKKIKHIN